MHCEISAPFDGKKSECVYIKTSKELSKSFFGMKQPQNLKKKKNKFTLQRIPVVFKINFWMNYAGMFWKQRTKGKKTSNLRLLNYTADCSVSVFRASVTSMEEISCRCEGGRVENGWRAEILSAQSLKKRRKWRSDLVPVRGLMFDVYRWMCASCVCCRGDRQRRKRVASDVWSLFWLPFLRLSPSLLSPAWLCVFLFFL